MKVEGVGDDIIVGCQTYHLLLLITCIAIDAENELQLLESSATLQNTDDKKKSSRRSRFLRVPSSSKRTLRDQLINTNIDIVLLGILLALYNTSVASQLFDNEDTTLDSTPLSLSIEEENELYYNDIDNENNNPVYAILFPFFTQTLAIIIYYLISRYIKVLPYTALVFLLGTIIGYVTTYNNNQENAVAESASIWLGINGQVILMVFLPGLIFNDSFTINVHLFFQGESVWI